MKQAHNMQHACTMHVQTKSTNTKYKVKTLLAKSEHEALGGNLAPSWVPRAAAKLIKGADVLPARNRKIKRLLVTVKGLGFRV